MTSNVRSLLAMGLLLAVMLTPAADATLTVTAAQSAPVTTAGARPAPASIQRALGQLPLLFVENRGQTDEPVAFTVLGGPNAVFFTPTGITYALVEPPAPGERRDGDRSEMQGSPEPHPRRWVVKVDFAGANANVTPRGEDPAETIVSYFRGRPEEWHTGLRTFRRIVYPDLWPGIDLVFGSAGGSLKYTFLVHPGADPAQIRLAYRGADVSLDEAGQVRLSTPFGVIADAPPVTRQESPSGRSAVSSAFTLRSAGDPGAPRALDGDGAVELGFTVGPYDHSQDLVLDPVVLIYCGYIGGSGNDYQASIAADAGGNLYVAGKAGSNERSFPVSVGPDLTFNGDYDIFVAKVNPQGTALLYAGYIGGKLAEDEASIALGPDGSAYVSGSTSSSESSFPARSAFDMTYNGGVDAFVAKLDPTGASLVYAGYLGGSGNDVASAVAVDAQGNAYVTGYTRGGFPLLIGPELTFDGNFSDAFVTKLDPSGQKLVYSGYIGGRGDDYGNDIAVDASGAAYITGETASPETTFPVTGGPDLIHNGDRDAFVAKVIPSGAGLAYAGYIGGPDWDMGRGIVVDSEANAYVVGHAFTAVPAFAGLPGPDPTFNGGRYDAFITKIRPDGTALVYAGYIGGALDESAQDIMIDAAGNAYITGGTDSGESSFPVLDGPDLTQNGRRDAFVTALDPSGTVLLYSGYVGGARDDEAHALAIDEEGAVYVAGDTDSDQTTFPAVGGLSQFHGGADVFFAKLGEAGARVDVLQAGARPAIDGDVREWRGLPPVRVDRDTASLVTGSQEDPPPADLSAALWTAWRPGVLYFAVDVTDDVLVAANSAKPWNDDAVEISLRAPQTGRDYQFTLGLDGSQYEHGNAISSLTVATRAAASGWSLEVVIPAWVIGQDAFVAGQVYPFTFALWDDDVSGFPSQTHMIWEGTVTDRYVPDWGRLELQPTVYDFPQGDYTVTPSPSPTATPTETPPAPTSTPTVEPSATATLVTPLPEPRHYLPLVWR